MQSPRSVRAGSLDSGREAGSHVMNKWQIICPLIALVIVGMTFATIHESGEHRSFINVASHSIGSDLVATTNSLHLIRIDPNLRAELSEFLAARANVSTVLLGDDLAPIGDGQACSRLVLTNDAGRGLLIRLRRAEQPGMFQVLGFRPLAS
jgi:hypothetical protein